MDEKEKSEEILETLEEELPVRPEDDTAPNPDSAGAIMEEVPQPTEDL